MEEESKRPERTKVIGIIARILSVTADLAVILGLLV